MARLWRSLDSRSGRIGLVVFLAIVLLAVFAPAVAPHSPYQQAIVRRLKPPAWDARGQAENPLGTDQLGRDILSRVIYGSRISLLVGAAAVFGAGLLGSFLGLIAGYFGGRLDYAISTLINAAWSFPFILLALIIVAVLGASLQNLIIALVATSWAAFARIVRGEVVALREREYVSAARSMGMRSWRVVVRHVLPNASASILVIASIEFGRAIIRESFLSFLGLGVPPSIPSWGGMLSEARPYIFTLPHLVTIPGVMIFVTTLSVNLFGDGLRDSLDPRLRKR
ncbi:MAG: ABC transporter permease [Trueperaceae bacterium]|nr:ABC transporter permease [Trueperaceae bacterium]